MISESILDSGDLIDLPYWADKLWLGLILLADNSGWIRADSHRLRARCMLKRAHRMPALAQVERAISTFVARSMLVPCRMEGVSGYRLTNFSAGQRLRDRTSSKNRHGDGDGDGDGDGEGGDCKTIAHEKPTAEEPKRSAPAEPISPVQVGIVEFYEVQFCMPAWEAREVVDTLRPTEADLPGWADALRAAKASNLRDFRAYVRSRAKKFRTAEEAFGKPVGDFAAINWEELVK
jgi:hypothetical protein